MHPSIKTDRQTETDAHIHKHNNNNDNKSMSKQTYNIKQTHTDTHSVHTKWTGTHISFYIRTCGIFPWQIFSTVRVAAQTIFQPVRSI